MELTGTAAESMETGLTSLLSKELVPPEYQGQSSKMSSKDMDTAHAVDIWQYGKLVETLIQYGLLHIKPSALPLERMLNVDPRKRPPGDVILESDIFIRNNSVSVVRYCRLKGLEKGQNAEWSQTIMPKLHMLAPSIMEKLVLPQLLTQEFFAAEGFDKLYRNLFTPQPPQPLISEEVYQSQVLPFMIKLWTYRQADIRMTIFRLFEVYLKAVVLGEGGSEVLVQIIMPEILSGLQDADPKVYLASLCGLATAIPYALLVTTLGDTDMSKQKISIKTLYEQTLIPQIMAFWISEDCTQESKVQVVEVIMGMWSSIYTLGLYNHPAVKDISAPLTIALVSVLKITPVSERVELISKSFTKHCTSGLFCISGLLKFLPQFLLDDDLQVREAAANAISTVAHQAITLVSQPDLAVEQQDQQHLAESDANKTNTEGSSTPMPPAPSPSSAHSVHVSRIRQYCEKQQSLLPPRRPIFSRSIFTGERSHSSSSMRSYNGVDVKGGNLSADLQSSRRSSIVSQDSFMFSEQGSLKTPSLLTPSLTRAGSFSADSTSRDTLVSTPGLDSHLSKAMDKPTQFYDPREELIQESGTALDDPIDHHAEEVTQEDTQAADELELMKALEAAKAEMKVRQLPVEQRPPSKTSSIPRGVDINPSIADNSTAFGWDDAGDDEGDDWDAEDSTSLNSPANQTSSPAVEHHVEDEATLLKREMEKAEKQEQLRQKRDQKQQEMQAKREARRQQLAEKQINKKPSSNGLKLGAVKAAPVSAPSSASVSVSAAITASSNSTAAPKPLSGRSMIRLPEGPTEEKDGWDSDENLDMGALANQLGAAAAAEDDDLFKDLEVSYKAPVYVGGTSVGAGPLKSSTSISMLSSSSKTLSSSTGTISTTRTLHGSVTATTSAVTSAPARSAADSATIRPAVAPVPGGSMSPSSAGSQSRRSSPVEMPQRVPSPLLRTASNGSINGSNGSNGVGHGKTLAISPALAPTTAPALPKTTPSLAVQVDEAALEEDGWGNDWD
ncbi:hypothetical protein BC939DRAFT_42948 [Gamsiella multidivaricata]|uniref:uncharacterized protein n=1 Tax=Gamsiella multidivaricata TaxID=101098 RepID=UPI00222037A4|nr:uncharacterized protein BC939DRAFT_42948 [Gamsiella multidivaricata]KAI7816483.1 hypothetical protein BC939DRAFT_42948 [Gamsiella multidivaricata]